MHPTTNSRQARRRRTGSFVVWRSPLRSFRNALVTVGGQIDSIEEMVSSIKIRHATALRMHVSPIVVQEAPR